MLSLAAAIVLAIAAQTDSTAQHEPSPYVLQVDGQSDRAFFPAARFREDLGWGRRTDEALLGFTGSQFDITTALAILGDDVHIVDRATGKRVKGSDLTTSDPALSAFRSLNPILLTASEHHGQSILAAGSSARATSNERLSLFDWLRRSQIDLNRDEVQGAWVFDGVAWRRCTLDDALARSLSPTGPASALATRERGGSGVRLACAAMCFTAAVSGAIGVGSMSARMRELEKFGSTDISRRSSEMSWLSTQRVAWGILSAGGVIGLVCVAINPD